MAGKLAARILFPPADETGRLRGSSLEALVDGSEGGRTEPLTDGLKLHFGRSRSELSRRTNTEIRLNGYACWCIRNIDAVHQPTRPFLTQLRYCLTDHLKS
jgi:hypothetical protein